MRLKTMLRGAWLMTAVAVVALGLSTPKAQASIAPPPPQVTFDFSNSLLLPVTGSIGNETYVYNAGAFCTKLDGSPVPSFYSYCVDVNTDLAFDQSMDATPRLVDASDGTKMNAAAWLVTHFDSPVINAEHACGLQLAIWNTLYGSEKDISSSSNTFQLFYSTAADNTTENTATITEFANYYINQLPTDGPATGYASLIYTNSNNQLVIADARNVNPAPVPELSTMTLLGTMLAGMGPLVIRKKRN